MKDITIKTIDCVYRTQDVLKDLLSLLEAENPSESRKLDITKTKIDTYDMEIDLEEDRLIFRCLLPFDADKYFGTDTQGNDQKWINFYTYWSPENGVTAAYEIDSDDNNEMFDWNLTREEKKFFLQKMEECCKQATGKNLNNFWNRIREEEDE